MSDERKGFHGAVYPDQKIAELCEQIAALKRSQEWQPIETAPKDGTSNLFWIAEHRAAVVAAWIDDAFRHDYCGIEEDSRIGGYDVPAATHWIPLPVAPGVSA